MPILGTGKGKADFESGYTLIEILAVLIMLSIVGLLAFPRYDRGEEKAYLKQIGNLIQADIRMVREEAVCGKTEIIMFFRNNGYSFDIGDTEIERVFDKHQFRWDFSLNELEKGEEFEEIDTYGFSDENSEADEENQDFGSSEWVFTSDGFYPETTLEWTSQSFIGTMACKADGSVNWEYSAKNRN